MNMDLQKPTSNLYLTNRVLSKPNMNNNNHNHHFGDKEVVEFPWCLKKSKPSFTSTIKGAFRRSLSNYAKSKDQVEAREEEGDGSFNNNNEEEIVVSEIRARARAMEARSKRKSSFILMLGDSFRRVVLSSTAAPTQQGDLCLEAELQNKGEEVDDDDDDDDDDDFLSVRSYLSYASSAARSREGTNFSRSRSMSGIDDDRQLNVLRELWREEDVRRRMIIKEIIHCEGWPFGLCRKALLLPPLPKSPAESWKWRNSAKFIRPT